MPAKAVARSYDHLYDYIKKSHPRLSQRPLATAMFAVKRLSIFNIQQDEYSK